MRLPGTWLSKEMYYKNANIRHLFTHIYLFFTLSVLDVKTFDL